MKQIYVIGLFFMCFQAYSQLYIKSNTDQDSYVYAEGNFLFVEKQVDLVLKDTDKNISGLFLRDEAQLIQGNSNTSNTGNGFLSVFQEGDATAYTYNYWSLPVSDISIDKKLDNIIFDPQDKLLSKKVLITTGLNGTAKPLTISNKWIYKFSGDNYYDWTYIGNNFNLSPGEGFSMKGVEGKNLDVQLYNFYNNPGGKQRYDFRGLPNNGKYSLPVKKEMSLLVGNPYPSALDLNLFLTENKNITGIAYFWDSASIDSHYLKDYEGGYGTYSPALGNYGYVPPIFKRYNGNGEELENTGNNGKYYARRVAPIAQGFMVIALNDGVIDFKNEYRAFTKENEISSQFKSKNADVNKNSEFSYLRLNIDFDHNYTRQLLLADNKNSTIHIDRAMDAENISKLDSDIGWRIDDKNFVINILPITENDHIPLELILDKSATITFQIVENNSFPYPIYLFDSNTNESHGLSNSEIFKIELENAIYKDRFYLTFSKEEPEVIAENISKEILEQISTFQNQDYRRLEINLPDIFVASEIELFDDRGRRILQLKGKQNEKYYELPTTNLSHGLYILKIKSSKGTYFSKKIIISK